MLQGIEDTIIVRGGGDIASGVIHRLYRCGFRVCVLECSKPTAIRRRVSFCEAVYSGETEVEGVTARRAEKAEECREIWKAGEIPLLIDPAGTAISLMKPAVVVDAILAKKNLGTSMHMAALTIALGPGFTAGKDVHYVIETMRGHNLGRIIREGEAEPNTGVPAKIKGYGKERVIYASAEGILQNEKEIGEWVECGEKIAWIGDTPVKASMTGLLRGMIRPGFYVKKGLKIADIDPRMSEYENCFTISDKARCIAGSVLEVILCEDERRWKDTRRE